MNAEQRKRLSQIIDQLNSTLCEIEEMKDEEEMKYDNLPESLQSSEKGDRFQEVHSTLDDAYSYLDDAISSLQEVEE